MLQQIGHLEIDQPVHHRFAQQIQVDALVMFTHVLQAFADEWNLGKLIQADQSQA